MKYKIYGYGIVDKNGNPWWDESCVCQDRAPMDEVCRDLNMQYDDICTESQTENHIPYRVVRLLYAVKDKR